MKLTLVRETNPQPDCTLGWLTVGDLNLATIERPWIPSTTCKGGLKGKSCVPVGTYHLVLHESAKHGRTWALVNYELDVVHYEGDDKDPDEDRATCLIHAATFVSNVIGCIGVGIAHARAADGQCMLKSPGKAMEKLREVLPYEPHELEIR